jgi:NaMN:DMB phosphoribosyltransferase
MGSEVLRVAACNDHGDMFAARESRIRRAAIACAEGVNTTSASAVLHLLLYEREDAVKSSQLDEPGLLVRYG